MAVKLLNGLALFGGNPYGGYGSYGRSGGAGLWQFIVGIIVGLVLTILLYVLVFPESRKASLNGFFQFIKDFFDMKYLLIEKILKFLYVLNTMTVISVGFFLLFGRTFVMGLLMIILGPIVQRLLYESIMLGILLVKNTMEINNKLGGSKEGSAFGGSFSMPKKPAPQPAPTAPAQPATPVQPAAPSQPVSQPVAPAPQAPTAPAQPTAPAASAPKVCPTCGTPLEAGAIFCAACGTKVQ
ncbi:MAG: zinc ribbon domain-containing protein [Eubacterium sp.]|nr:zinc ribbon domain-containing protein [Eubacterium sp.]